MYQAPLEGSTCSLCFQSVQLFGRVRDALSDFSESFSGFRIADVFEDGVASESLFFNVSSVDLLELEGKT